jgi:hypothetical protein
MYADNSRQLSGGSPFAIAKKARLCLRLWEAALRNPLNDADVKARDREDRQVVFRVATLDCRRFFDNSDEGAAGEQQLVRHREV